MRSAKSKLGVNVQEVEALKEGIMRALENGPLDTAGLKEPLGSLYKNYGEAGKKIGQTTNVSLGLLALQAEAKIRRIPSDGRLDGQSYKYTFSRMRRQLMKAILKLMHSEISQGCFGDGAVLHRCPTFSGSAD